MSREAKKFRNDSDSSNPDTLAVVCWLKISPKYI